MSAEARYFRVGLFVFIGFAVIAAAAVVLGGRGLFTREILMETYFDEAVTGLEIGSPVRFRGVRVGTVSQIGFADDFFEMRPEDAARVRNLVVVRMKITPVEGDTLSQAPEEAARGIATLVEQGLRFRITSSGLTGTSFVLGDLLDPERHPPMDVPWTPSALYVPSSPSTMAALTSGAERLAEQLADTDIAGLVKNLDQLVSNLDAVVVAFDVDGLETEAQGLLAELRATNRKVATAIEDAEVAALSADAQASLVELRSTLTRVQRLVDGSDYDLAATLENLRVTSENLREVSDTARSYPSWLLLGEPPPTAEVSAPPPGGSAP